MNEIAVIVLLSVLVTILLIALGPTHDPVVNLGFWTGLVAQSLVKS